MTAQPEQPRGAFPLSPVDTGLTPAEQELEDAIARSDAFLAERLHGRVRETFDSPSYASFPVARSRNRTRNAQFAGSALYPTTFIICDTVLSSQKQSCLTWLCCAGPVTTRRTRF